MSYNGDFLLSQDNDFKRTIRIAMMRISMVILSPGSSTGNPTEDAMRKEYAHKILADANQYVDNFALAAVTNPATKLNAESLDSDVQSVVDAIFSIMAGYVE